MPMKAAAVSRLVVMIIGYDGLRYIVEVDIIMILMILMVVVVYGFESCSPRWLRR